MVRVGLNVGLDSVDERSKNLSGHKDRTLSVAFIGMVIDVAIGAVQIAALSDLDNERSN
jgi:hypothetical protein